jgi:hypothetical protein
MCGTTDFAEFRRKDSVITRVIFFPVAPGLHMVGMSEVGDVEFTAASLAIIFQMKNQPGLIVLP